MTVPINPGTRRDRSRRGLSRCYSRGVTMVELMFAIAILAVLISIAVPSFRDASLGGRLTAIASSLHASVLLARSEAIKANAPTTLCASANGADCAASGDWEQGWILLDDEGTLIDSRDALPSGFKVTEGAATLALTFRPIGVGSSAATFTVCRDSPLGNQERIVSVTATGAPRITRTETASCP